MSELFATTKVRDFDVVILKENGWINYTKLCKDLTGKSDKFKGLIRKNPDLHQLILSYNERLMKGPQSLHEITIDNLIKLNIFIKYGSILQVKNPNYVGTYGPRYILDFIIMTCNISYYKLIHEALESIDNYTSATNKSFITEINDIKSTYEYRIRHLNDENTSLKKDIEELKQINLEQTKMIKKQTNKIDNQTKMIEEQTNKIDNQTKILTEVKQSLTSIADSVSDLNKHITSNKICKYHILLWLDKDNQKKTKSSDDVTIKTFVGLIENTPKLTKDDKILLRKDVSCSLDSFKTVLANLSDMAFTTNYRNIIIKQFKIEKFIIKFQSELIEINNPIDNIKETIIDLESTVKEQNTRLDKIENQLNLICQFYDITEEKFNEIENGDWSFKFKNRWRDIKINRNKNKLYVNHGKNNNEIHYLIKGDI